MFGVGVERRWSHFALQAELRGISVGERDEDDFEKMPVDGSTRDPATGERDPRLQVAFEGLYLPSAPASPPG